jgi:DnaK suppressor protein
MSNLQMKQLRSMYVELKDELVNILQKSNYEIDVAGDAIDKIQGKNLAEIQNRLSQKNLAKLRALSRAIDLIDCNEYGNCEECGGSIGLKRLETLPGITLCISCAEQAEFNK